VYKDDEEINLEDEKMMMTKLLFKTQAEYDKNEIGEGGTWGGVKLRKKKESLLKARIDYVDSFGIVIVKFNIPVFQINNLTLIDETVMHLELVEQMTYRRRNLNFTWYCVNMTSTTIKL
jgi:hypothetical protein